MTLFRIFTLHPDIFNSFLSQSLVARGISKDIIRVDKVNWRETHGLGNYKQVDDKPFGGGSGMVLLPEPIFKALDEFQAISELFKINDDSINKSIIQGSIADLELLSDPLFDDLLSELDLQKISSENLKSKLFQSPDTNNTYNSQNLDSKYTPPLIITDENEIQNSLESANQESNSLQTPEQIFYNTTKSIKRIFPNNFEFFNNYKTFKNPTKITISLTPRGFPINQQILEWLAKDFTEINLLCGRYEGFDSRVSEAVDLELSLGNFVLNGGEVASMALIEGISRLLPDFVTKSTSVAHDSFSSGLNQYDEQNEFVVGKNNLSNNLKSAKTSPNLNKTLESKPTNLFNNYWFKDNILPHIEHPQYTRPLNWKGYEVPEVLKNGNHKKIQEWRKKWY